MTNSSREPIWKAYPSFQLPCTFNLETEDNCPKCKRTLIQHCTHLVAICTEGGGFFLGYRPEGYLYCGTCGYLPAGMLTIPPFVMAKVRPKRVAQQTEKPTRRQKVKKRKAVRV